MSLISLPPVIDATNPLRTRADFARLVEELWRGVSPAFRAGDPRVRLGQQACGSGDRGESMENFSRVFWGLGPWRAGGGAESVDWPRLRGILLAGMTADGWGVMKDYDHLIVESCAVAIALVLARDVFWDPLAPEEQSHVAHWLGRINQVRVVENNWLWFRVLVNASLRQLGQPHDRAREEADLAQIDTMWYGDGGYSDGPEEHRDTYVPMGMHFYGLIYARMVRDEAPERARQFRERARQFAHEFLPWFARDGAMPAFGRSLHYRFAPVAFWSALAYAEEDVFSWGVLRGVIGRHLRDWLRRPIFNGEGRLSVGYGHHQPHLCEGYGSAGSPYWALKVFLLLALPDTHAFWQAEEEPLPDLPAVHGNRGFSMTVLRPHAGTDVVLLAASRSRRDWLRHNEAKYHKFSYSARFGFSLAHGWASLTLLAPDSMLALSDDGGRHWRVREESTSIHWEGNTLVAVWQPWSDVVVETRLTPGPEGNGHLREHLVETPRALQTFEGGFCVPSRPDRPAAVETGTGFACAEGEGYRSELRDEDGQRSGGTVIPDTGTHLLWPLTCLPGLETSLTAGRHRLRCRVTGRPPNV